MLIGLTDRVRSYVRDQYVLPARKAGKGRVAVRVKDVKQALGTGEAMRKKSAQICQALNSAKLLLENSLEVESTDGPPSKRSSTVVVHYRLLPTNEERNKEQEAPIDTAEARAARITRQLRGLMKNEIASYGGAEAYMRWVRYDEAPLV